MILINKHNLSAVMPAVSTEESRYTLKGIHVTEQYTEATDGHRAIRVSLPKQDLKGFPEVAGFTRNGFTSCLLPLDSAVAIQKAIPKSKVLPVLNFAAISQNDAGLQVAVTDLDNPQVFAPKNLTGQFPNIDQSLPKDAPLFEISLSPQYLADLALSAARFGDKYGQSVKVKFYGSDKPVMMHTKNSETGQTWDAALMPMRDKQ